MGSVVNTLARLSHSPALMLLCEHGLLHQSTTGPPPQCQRGRTERSTFEAGEADSGIDSSPETHLRERRLMADTARAVAASASAVRERKVVLHQTFHLGTPSPVVWKMARERDCISRRPNTRNDEITYRLATAREAMPPAHHQPGSRSRTRWVTYGSLVGWRACVTARERRPPRARAYVARAHAVPRAGAARGAG